MREAVRQKLIAEIPAFGERVYEPNVAGMDEQKPFAVVQFGPDDDEAEWVGFRRTILIYLLEKIESYKALDITQELVINALKNPLVTEDGVVFTLVYSGALGEDMHNAEHAALFRILRFHVYALQPVEVAETYAADSWVDSLKNWTNELFNPSEEIPWNVYENQWPLGYLKPAVLWRLAAYPRIDEEGLGQFRVTKSFQGHVLGDTPNQQVLGIGKVVEEFGIQLKIPVVGPDNCLYMTRRELSVDMGADPIRTGQISVTFDRLTRKPFIEDPLIGEVLLEGRSI